MLHHLQMVSNCFFITLLHTNLYQNIPNSLILCDIMSYNSVPKYICYVMPNWQFLISLKKHNLPTLCIATLSENRFIQHYTLIYNYFNTGISIKGIKNQSIGNLYRSSNKEFHPATNYLQCTKVKVLSKETEIWRKALGLCPSSTGATRLSSAPATLHSLSK